MIFLLLSVIQSYYLNSYNTEIFKKVGEAKENLRPASLQLVKIADSSCTDCFNIDLITNAMKTLNVNITNSKTLDFSSAEAKQLINQYNIKVVPALIVSGETTKSTIQSYWPQLNGKELDGIVYIQSFPPYRNLTSGNVEGLVNLITLTDNSCNTCYNVSVQKQILQGFGLGIKSESTYDINSSAGEGLLNKYNITKVPTILLSPETKVYSSLVQAWSQVGTIEKDGWFVFRATEAMGAYKDISTGKIIQPQK